MNLKEFAEKIGLEVISERGLPTGATQVGVRYKGRRTSVVGKSYEELLRKLTEKYFEWFAEDHGRSREEGKVLADAAIKEAIMEDQKNST